MRIINLRMLPARFMVLMAVAGIVKSRTKTVDANGPADFDSIQAAINDSNHDDTITVFPGTYTGSGIHARPGWAYRGAVAWSLCWTTEFLWGCGGVLPKQRPPNTS